MFSMQSFVITAAHIMFLASNICCVSSGTVNARYCCEPREVSGAKPFMKKWRRGKGTSAFLDRWVAVARSSE